MGKILVLACNTTRLVKYPMFFGTEQCVSYPVDPVKASDKSYMKMVKEEIAVLCELHDVEFVGFERFPVLCTSVGMKHCGNKRVPPFYEIDAKELLAKFGLTKKRVLHLDMADRTFYELNGHTLPRGSLMLKGQCQAETVVETGNTPTKRTVWCPYWSGREDSVGIMCGSWTRPRKLSNEVAYYGSVGGWKFRREVAEFLEKRNDSCVIVHDQQAQSLGLDLDACVEAVLRSKVAVCVRGVGILSQTFLEILSLRACCLCDSEPIETLFWPVHPVNGVLGECCEVFRSEELESFEFVLNRILSEERRRSDLAYNGRQFYERFYSPSALRAYGDSVLRHIDDVEKIIPFFVERRLEGLQR